MYAYMTYLHSDLWQPGVDRLNECYIMIVCWVQRRSTASPTKGATPAHTSNDLTIR